MARGKRDGMSACVCVCVCVWVHAVNRCGCTNEPVTWLLLTQRRWLEGEGWTLTGPDSKS